MPDDVPPPGDEPFVAAATGPRVRRRRRLVVTGAGGETPDAAARVSVWAFVVMGLLGIWGMFAAAAPLPALHGTLWVGLGLSLVLIPPRFKISWWWIAAGVLVLAGAAMALLPVGSIAKPAWRIALEGLGVATGGRVTTQPGLTLMLWSGLAVSVIAGWFLLGHRVPEAAVLPLSLLMALGIAGYAGVSMLAWERNPRWSWDPVETFGFFGNRNHTATVLVMGLLAALGGLLEGVRSKRGGWAGLAALALVICAGGLFGFSISRAGVVLAGGGMMAWLTAMGLGGGRYFSRRMALAVFGFLLVGGGLFWWTDNTLKSRIEESWARWDNPVAGGASGIPATANGGAEAAFDLRVLIYRDTLRMIQGEPVTGVGLGQFPWIFPQYREEAAVSSKVWHPESNWGLLAAEAGWGTAAVLAVAVAGLFFQAFRAGRRHRGWPLTLGLLLAAAAVPVHGLFDVPAYHPGIAWPCLWLIALVFRPGTTPADLLGGPGRLIFRVLGLIILGGGMWIFHTGGPAGGLPNPLVASIAITEAKALYARDAAEKADPVQHPPSRRADGSVVDQLEAAQKVVQDGLRTAPLDPELHYLKGLLSVNFSDEEALADQAFAAQRLLEPDWVEVPWRQGLAWLTIDPARTIPLWQEAMRRAAVADGAHPGAYWSPGQLREQIQSAAKSQPMILDHFAP